MTLFRKYFLSGHMWQNNLTQTKANSTLYTNITLHIFCISYYHIADAMQMQYTPRPATVSQKDIRFPTNKDNAGEYDIQLHNPANYQITPITIHNHTKLNHIQDWTLHPLEYLILHNYKYHPSLQQPYTTDKHHFLIQTTKSHTTKHHLSLRNKSYFPTTVLLTCMIVITHASLTHNSHGSQVWSSSHIWAPTKQQFTT